MKEALAAAFAHEKALAAVDAAQNAAQQSMQELAAKAKAAGDKVGGDGAVKIAPPPGPPRRSRTRTPVATLANARSPKRTRW